jgi:hypothetical protein
MVIARRRKRRKEHVMNTPLTRRPDGNGVSAEAVPGHPDRRGRGGRVPAGVNLNSGLAVVAAGTLPWLARR